MLGEVAPDEEAVFESFTRRFPPRGKRVLEIGGALSAELALAASVKEWVAVDPHFAADSSVPRYRMLRAAASSVPLESGSFDLAFSCNAFEHIANVGATLKEAYRLLRPGGVLYTHFGPIWSGPDGHHLDVRVDGVSLSFWEISVLPHWSHLVLSEGEMAEMLSRRYQPGAVRTIVDAVYRSSWLNRMTYEDYLRTFLDSGLKLAHLETAHEVNYEFEHPDYGLPEQLFRQRAESKEAAGANIRCRDILAVLYR